ncbi:hypothetical protein PHAVU_005G077450 [Phaseolus vulgaris]
MLNGVQKFERILVPFQLLVQVDQAFDNIHVSSQEDAVLINWGSRRNDYIEEAMLFGCVEMDVAEINLKRESLVNEPVLKVDHVQREVTNSHKGIYSKILEIQEP